MNLHDVSFPDDQHITLNLEELRTMLKDCKAALSSTRQEATKVYFFGKVDLLRDIINFKHK